MDYAKITSEKVEKNLIAFLKAWGKPISLGELWLLLGNSCDSGYYVAMIIDLEDRSKIKRNGVYLTPG